MNARCSPQRVHGAARQRGVSLIELMVSMVIGLLLIGGALRVYTQSRSTQRTTETASRLQEAGRYALGVIEPDVRLAGFWGMTNRPDLVQYTVNDASIANNCGASWLGAASTPVEAVDGSVTYALGCTITNRMPNSDVLIVRRADSRVLAAPVANTVQVQSNRVRAVIFTGTTLPTGLTAATSETRQMVANVYYVSQTAGGRPPALRRRTLVGLNMQDEEVVPGVEDMQIQMGVDTNGDTTADRYVNPNLVGAARVVSVRIWLRVIAEDRDVEYRDTTAYQYANATFTAANDDKRRIVLSKTIQIRNSKP